MQLKKIEEFVDDQSVFAACVLDLNTNKLVTVGDPCEHGESLFNSLLGDQEKLDNMSSYIHGQIMPRFWSQGDLSCALCLVKEDILVALFFLNEGFDSNTEYDYILLLDNKLKKLFAS